MACVSKPMRMRDFPFQPADTLLQYSLLKQLHASSTAPQKNTVRFFIFHGPFSSSSPSSPSSSSLSLLLLSKTPFFSDALGLQQKIAYMFFCVCVCVCVLPKAEDCERVDERRTREQHGARKQEMMGCKKRQRHAIHTVTSGTLVKNHNPLGGKKKKKTRKKQNNHKRGEKRVHGGWDGSWIRMWL